MITSIRNKFNAQFTEAKYKNYLAELELPYPGCLEFRIAETPVFVPKEFKHKLLEVSEYISSVILSKDFKKITEQATPAEYNVPMETPFPACVVMDFAVSKNASDELEPQLIELQGFPSLFAFEILQDQTIRNNYTIPDGFTCYLNGYDEFKYINHLKTLIEGTNNKHTVLLELYPHQQKTRIDFYCTEKYVNIPTVCITEIFTEGNILYYQREGNKIKIDRIYNRIILDELKHQTKEIQEKGALLESNLDIEWVTHPHHFFRISKFLLPFLKHTNIPHTQFVDQLTEIPTALEKYILKPLFSFAGQGVIIDISLADIENIKDPSGWILQEKVNYANCIETPTGPAKAELRLFYFWDEEKQQYIATMNLARLSKGKMIGVNYNKNATWVGGSLAYFETTK